jgi:hypothetical protein
MPQKCPISDIIGGYGGFRGRVIGPPAHPFVRVADYRDIDPGYDQ